MSFDSMRAFTKQILAVCKPLLLNLTCPLDAFADCSGGFVGFVADEFFISHCGHFDVDIECDPISVALL